MARERLVLLRLPAADDPAVSGRPRLCDLWRAVRAHWQRAYPASDRDARAFDAEDYEAVWAMLRDYPSKREHLA